MNEIYWLTRVGTINDIGGIMAVVSGLFLGIFPLICSLMDFSDQEWFKPKIALRWLIGMLITGLLILAFVPTKKDLYLIYGLGTIIDYVNDNEKVKEIPDKAIDAIMEYFEIEEHKK